ncbi:hypothetical protein EDC96DRAFT_548158 [Choanephora cucurbitarum]|nr:hypothetical protein EDC96DRAFT_548158 [Choanephora cucurbitarum]
MVIVQAIESSLKFIQLVIDRLSDNNAITQFSIEFLFVLWFQKWDEKIKKSKKKLSQCSSNDIVETETEFVSKRDAEKMAQQKSDSKSSSTVSTSVPYYGSREPKQSVIETDKLIFEMMDDMSKLTKNQSTQEKQEHQEHEELESQKHIPITTWRTRIVLVSFIIILLVIDIRIKVLGLKRGECELMMMYERGREG